jgi:hypothetical protein
VTLLDAFGLLVLQPYDDDHCREAVYTLCLPVDDCVHCFLSVTPTWFYPMIKRAYQYNQFKKQAERGNTYIALHNTHFTRTKVSTHFIHNIGQCIIMPSENIETQWSIPLAL